MEHLIKIGKLKEGDLFEMAGREYVITRSGHGYYDVEFKLKDAGKQVLTTSNKNLIVTFIKSKQ